MRVLGASVVVAVLLFAAATGDATPPCCAHVPAGLTSWWPANDSGADVVGGHTATLSGAVAYADAKVGRGWVFDDVNDYVSVDDHADFTPGTDSFTADAWVKTSGPEPSGGQEVIRHYECAGAGCSDAGSSSNWELRLLNHRAWGFIRDADKGGPAPEGEGQYIEGTKVVDDGVFHHIALVRDQVAGHARLYVDGVLDADEALNAGASGALSNLDGDADPVTIGGGLLGGTSSPDSNITFTGTIDEADWWRTALTGDQIAAIANAGAGGKCTDEVAPTSSATAPASGTVGTPIAVSYSASDTGGAGLARVILLVRTPGATGFAEAATDENGSGAGTFSYTPTAGPGDYGFATSAEDANCGRETAPADPDAVTRVAAATTTTPPTTTPPQTPPPTPVPITQIATLPSPHVCVSRRHFPIHLKGVKGIVKAVIKLTGVPARTVKGKALGLPIDLRGLPKGKVVVRITVTTKAGKRLVGKRTYHTCASRRIVKKH
jgi:hypothetical protein